MEGYDINDAVSIEICKNHFSVCIPFVRKFKMTPRGKEVICLDAWVA